MSNTRKKIHQPFFRIPALQILAEISDSEMAKRLGCAVRTYQDKVSGWLDFKPLEAQAVSDILGESQDYIFFTRDVPKSTP